MAVLQQLGINQTYFFQLAIFVFTLITLSSIFKSFVELAKKRHSQTTGGEENASDIFRKTNELQERFVQKAKQLNEEIKKIYDATRVDANEEYEKTVTKARAAAAKLADGNLLKITTEVTEARRRLTDEVPLVAAAITQKLLKENGKT